MSKNLKIHNVNNSARATILDILVLCGQGSYSNEILPARLSRSKFIEPDKALITKVVYSTLRQQIRIDYAIEKISSRKLKSVDPIARAALRSTICQLIDGFEMHAALNETVKVLPFSLKGFVNAVSRKAIELHKKEKLFIDEPENVELSLPDWIFAETQSVFGDKASEVANSFNLPAFVTLAPVNKDPMPVIKSREGVLVKKARLITNTGDLFNSPYLKSGDYIVSDQGSQLVASCVSADKTQTVLDVCSAPGGKAIMVSQKASAVFASDISPRRMEKLIQTRERVGADNVYCFASDALDLPFDEDQKFDSVLVDAPCSGLGVLRRRPDARHNITPEDVSELHQLQKKILTSTSKLVKENGELVYSVCTFTKSETIDIDDWLKSEHPELVAQEMVFNSPLVSPLGRGYLVAGTQDNDAMYILKLVKS